MSLAIVVVKILLLNEATGLPITSKSDTTKHGYGLKNIKRIARKYNGDIKISIKNSRFVLNIMMMLRVKWRCIL